MNYRPNLTEIEEYQEELENAIDDCITYISLAIQSINDYREFDDLKKDIQTTLEIARDNEKEVKRK